MQTVQLRKQSSESLDRTLIRGLAWTGAAKWIGQAVSWMATIVVARLLDPSDYGLLAMATGFLSILALINEFGLGSAIVYQQELSGKQIAQLNSLALMLGVAGFGFAAFAARPLAMFYHAPELTWVLIVLGLGFVVSGLTSVPNAALEKQLHFTTLAILEGIESVLGATLTIALAWCGYGYWALVWGRLLALMGRAVMLLVFWRQRFAFPCWHDNQKIISMSWQVCFGRLCWTIGSHSDVFVAGRVLGQVALGAYSMALTLASMPMDKIATLFSRVSPALFSLVQSDQAGLTRYFLALTSALSLIALPVAIGLTLVGDELVRLILGDKWEAAIVPLQILAVYSGFRATTSPVAFVILAVGEIRFGMWNAVLLMFILPLAFYIGSSWGAAGIALAWVIAHPLIHIGMCQRAFRRIALPVLVYVQTLWPALSAAGVMVFCVLGVGSGFSGEVSILTLLVCKVIVGTVAYLCTILIFHRKYVDMALHLIRRSKG